MPPQPPDVEVVSAHGMGGQLLNNHSKDPLNLSAPLTAVGIKGFHDRSPSSPGHLPNEIGLDNSPAASVTPIPPSRMVPASITSPEVAKSFGLKSSHISTWKKGAWIFFTMGIFLLPYIVLKACFHIQVSAGAW
ncbi:hypothetical protein BGW39_005353 [Mortierella sp. 14UC]|nr:hypothetical protein BGW39_005353 [Mortierella sp. 14UC]